MEEKKHEENLRIMIKERKLKKKIMCTVYFRCEAIDIGYSVILSTNTCIKM